MGGYLKIQGAVGVDVRLAGAIDKNTELSIGEQNSDSSWDRYMRKYPSEKYECTSFPSPPIYWLISIACVTK